MKKIMWGAYIVFVCVFILGTLEWALRSDYLAPSYQQHNINIILDEDILYKVKPNSAIEINNYGFRGSDYTTTRNDKKRILVLGDSFMMGMNVKSDQTMPAALEQRLGKSYEVYNMGIIGYGPDQSLVQFQTIGKKFKPDIAVLGLFGTNDFMDLIKNELFFINEQGELQRNPDNPVKKALPASRIQYFLEWSKDKKSESNVVIKDLFGRLFWDAYTFDLMDNLNSSVAQKMIATMRLVLREFKQKMGKEGIDLVIVIIPNVWNTYTPDKLVARKTPPDKYFIYEDTLATLCQEESIKYINIHKYVDNQSLPFKIFDMDDGHLSVEGNRFIADIVASKILNK